VYTPVVVSNCVQNRLIEEVRPGIPSVVVVSPLGVDVVDDVDVDEVDVEDEVVDDELARRLR
jgi:hypothetical protein